ncbi:MAG: M48 family metallopeptidase [Bacteroidales bacterium]
MSKKIKTYPMIGEVDFVKSRRARKITLSVRPGRKVRMTMPWHAAYRDAETFLLRHMDWLKEKVVQARLYEQSQGIPIDPDHRANALEDLRKRAADYLPGRTALLAKEHGFSYRRVSLRASRTRWGSCSAVNNINLSIFLMQLPPHLIDYVILHELVHTVHKNHGPDFWHLLETLTGGARALAREIRKHRISL